MSSSLWRTLLGIVVWGLILTATLSIANWPREWGHGVCGLWGCGPPLQALLACHLSWLVVLLPLAVVLPSWLSWRQQRMLGVLVVMIGCAGLVGLVAYEFSTWWLVASEWKRSFFWRRVGFVIATDVDLPLIELILAGTCFLTKARSTRIRGTPSENASATRLASPQNPFSPAASSAPCGSETNRPS